jgi:hypothetical protein
VTPIECGRGKHYDDGYPMATNLNCIRVEIGFTRASYRVGRTFIW